MTGLHQFLPYRGRETTVGGGGALSLVHSGRCPSTMLPCGQFILSGRPAGQPKGMVALPVPGRNWA